MDVHLLDQFKEALLNLCPILSTVNWKRRVTDESGKSPYMQMIARAGLSIIVAAIIGVSSGVLSAYIALNNYRVELDGLHKQVDDYIQYDNHRADKTEDRLNSFLDTRRR